MQWFFLFRQISFADGTYSQVPFKELNIILYDLVFCNLHISIIIWNGSSGSIRACFFVRKCFLLSFIIVLSDFCPISIKQFVVGVDSQTQSKTLIIQVYTSSISFRLGVSHVSHPYSRLEITQLSNTCFFM